MMKSNFCALRAGMMPSQSEVTVSQVTFILAHRAWPISTSKPTTWPLASLLLKGGYAPSMPIFRVSAAKAPVVTASVATAASRKCFRVCIDVAPLAIAGHELFAACRLRVIEDLMRRSLFFYQPLMQEDHFTGHLPGKIHFMSDHQHGPAF